MNITSINEQALCEIASMLDDLSAEELHQVWYATKTLVETAPTEPLRMVGYLAAMKLSELIERSLTREAT